MIIHNIQHMISCCMLLIDDIILVAKWRRDVNIKLEQ